MDRIGGNKGYNISVIAIIDLMLRILFHHVVYAFISRIFFKKRPNICK